MLSRPILFKILGPLIEFLIFPIKLAWAPIDWYFGPRIARANQKAFEDEIRRDADFLFAVHGGEVVPNQGVPFPPGSGGAFVTIAASGMLIRFERGRGDFNVCIAPAHRPNDWTDLDVLLSAIKTPENIQHQLFRYVSEAAPALENHWEDIRAALQLDSIREAIDRFRAEEQHNLEAASRELNRRIYGG